MSGIERMRARLALRPLRFRLKDAGIKVPDEKRVERLKEAASLGFGFSNDAYSPYWRLRFGLWKRFQQWRHGELRSTALRVFDYVTYSMGNGGSREYGGGMVPFQVRCKVRIIRAALPGVTLRTHASRETGFLEVRYRGQSVIANVWQRRQVII